MRITLRFTSNLARHIGCPEAQVTGRTLREALDDYFYHNPQVRSYVLDDQNTLRKHVAVFINQTLISDRRGLSDPIADGDEVFVMQALSGG